MLDNSIIICQYRWITVALIITELYICNKDVFNWYTVILFLWRTTGRRMGHYPFTIKIYIWNIKDKISTLLRLYLIFFIWREIITTFNKKMTSFHLLYKHYIMVVNVYLSWVQNLGTIYLLNWKKKNVP